MNATVTSIEQPDEIETAWAQHEDRQRIIDAYDRATTKAARTAARWAAIEYDMANPGTSRLVDELDGDTAQAA